MDHLVLAHDVSATCTNGITGSGKIAVIDDDEGVRNSLLFLLESIGYSAIGFAAAADFLVSDIRPIRCLILDQQMPEVTGLQLAAKLRAAGIAIPILLMTGSPSPETTKQAAHLGLGPVPEKPLKERDILAFISATFSKLG